MKKKGQQYDFKTLGRDTRGNRPALRSAIYGKTAGWRERLWANGLAWASNDANDEFTTLLEKVVVPEMRAAARKGDRAAFERLAVCVGQRKQMDRAFGKSGSWGDPLAARIVEWHGGLHSEPFNIDRFIRDTNAGEDRKTISKRVRALGLTEQEGRPRVER